MGGNSSLINVCFSILIVFLATFDSANGNNYSPFFIMKLVCVYVLCIKSLCDSFEFFFSLIMISCVCVLIYILYAYEHN